MGQKHSKEFVQSIEIVSATPKVGLGNPIETAAITAELANEGLRVAAHYPHGVMVQVGSEFHIRMTASTDRTMRYAQNSADVRESVKTKPLLWEFRNFIVDMLKTYPNAQFFLTPQNMLGELATQIELNGKKFTVIMVLPDAMGKLLPNRRPSDTQRLPQYLVWNEQAYRVMKDQWKLNVQLTKMVDPLKGFKKLNRKQIESAGLPEVFEQENICVIKLSGSGGDPHLIYEITKALWKNSEIRSIIFPGKGRTKLNLAIRQWLEKDKPGLKSFLNEELFYNVARQMDHSQQLLLTYPSEQFKHSMVLSENGTPPHIVWLPPRGNHEVLNLIHYLYLIREQNSLTTICIPKSHQQNLNTQLAEYGFQQGRYYQMVEPTQLKREHFIVAPRWEEKLIHIPVVQAIKKIMANQN